MKSLIALIGTRKTIYLAVLLVFSVITYSYFGLHVSKTLRPEDIEAIKLLVKDDLCEKAHLNFASQVSCIKSLQKTIIDFGEDICSGRFSEVEPINYVSRGYGCCYNRARVIEKSLIYFGFKTRRVFLLQNIHGKVLDNFLPLNQQSHAATEVLTQRGWLGVDSTHPFVLVDSLGEPRTYKFVIVNQLMANHLVPKHFYEHPIQIVYGLYSRHGFFHGPHLPGPEMNFSEFLYNFH